VCGAFAAKVDAARFLGDSPRLTKRKGSPTRSAPPAIAAMNVSAVSSNPPAAAAHSTPIHGDPLTYEPPNAAPADNTSTP
jgi:hypothetical protein